MPVPPCANTTAKHGPDAAPDNLADNKSKQVAVDKSKRVAIDESKRVAVDESKRVTFKISF